MVTQDVPDWTSQGVTATIVGNVTDFSAPIACSSSGPNEIVAAIAATRIVVRAVKLSAAAAVNAKFQSDGTPDDLEGLTYLVAQGGYVMPYLASGWFETLAGEALSLDLSAAVAVGGVVVYGKVT